MCAIDECSQIIGTSIKSARRKKIDAIVTPAESAGEICNWHHFQQSDASVLQLLEFFGRRRPRSFRRESTDVKFVHDLASQFEPAPIGVAPCECKWIDHARAAVWPVRLKAGCRIRKTFAAVNSKLVARPRRAFNSSSEVAAFFACE